MRKIRLILVITMLAVVAFAGGLLVSAALNAPAQVQASPAQLNNSAAAAASDNAALPDNSDVSGLAAPDLNSLVNGFAGKGPGAFGLQAGPEERGIISSTTNSGNTLLMHNKRVISLNAQTSVGDANGTLSATDLKAGDYVYALGTVQSDKSLLARWVLRLPPPPQAKRGTVTSVNPANNSFQFKVSSTTWTANLTTNTKIFKVGSAGTFSSIAVNDEVTVIGAANTNAATIAATLVQDGKPGIAPGAGNVAAGAVNTINVSGNSFVITATAAPRMPRGQNPPPATNTSQLTVTVDSSTRYVGTNFKGLGDLKAGDRVIIRGVKQSDGSIKAQTIARMSAGFGGKPGNGKAGGQSGNFRGNNGNNNFSAPRPDGQSA